MTQRFLRRFAKLTCAALWLAPGCGARTSLSDEGTALGGGSGSSDARSEAMDAGGASASGGAGGASAGGSAGNSDETGPVACSTCLAGVDSELCAAELLQCLADTTCAGFEACATAKGCLNLPDIDALNACDKACPDFVGGAVLWVLYVKCAMCGSACAATSCAAVSKDVCD